MEAIKQYFDIEKLTSEEASEKGMTGFIIQAISNTEKYDYKRIIDNDGNMVTIYKEKNEKEFLLVIGTGIGRGHGTLKVTHYIITPKEEQGEHYAVIGSLIKQILKENNITEDIELNNFKEVFAC